MNNEEKILELLQALDAKIDRQKQEILSEVGVQLSRQKQEILGEVAVMVDEKIAGSETRMMDHTNQAIETAERRMQVLMESFFTPRFNLLAENQQIIREQMVKKEDLDRELDGIRTDIELLKVVVKKTVHDVEILKKAQ